MYKVAKKEIKLVYKQNGGNFSQDEHDYIYDKYGIPKTYFGTGKQLNP